jgi:hypothetical protein
MVAADRGHIATVELLHRLGVDINAADKARSTWALLISQLDGTRSA